MDYTHTNIQRMMLQHNFEMLKTKIMEKPIFILSYFSKVFYDECNETICIWLSQKVRSITLFS
jgi:hypothetical protein